MNEPGAREGDGLGVAEPERVFRTGPEFVRSLERGLAVIRAFNADNPELTLSGVARITGLTRAAARRFLHTLVNLGYMRSEGNKFALRPKILELGYAYLSSLSLPEVAMPHLEQLVEKVRESSSVCVLDGDEVVYVARVPTKRIMTVAISVGTRFLRKLTPYTIVELDALRAELQRIQAKGWALVDQELEEGLRSIAAPIHDRDGRVIAAMNVSAHASRRSVSDMTQTLLQPLLHTACLIDADLCSTGGMHI